MKAKVLSMLVTVLFLGSFTLVLAQEQEKRGQREVQREQLKTGEGLPEVTASKEAAPGAPEPNWGYRNQEGAYDLRKAEPRAMYCWPDNTTFYNDKLTFVRYSNLVLGTVVIDRGWIYKDADQNFWLFFGNTNLGGGQFRVVYSFNSDQGPYSDLSFAHRCRPE